MPASLTNQIRLGFSLGWRIWTPNEVGFYAKSLAHSYFIYNVLSTKFFMKKLWVVNYSIFVGVRKYYVFIEYLKFGIKTKEERSFWKKVMYITLMVRHPSLALSNQLSVDDNYAMTRGIYKYFGKLEKKKYKTEIDRHRETYLMFLAGIKKNHTFIVRSELDILATELATYLNSDKDDGVTGMQSLRRFGKMAKTKYKDIRFLDYGDAEFRKLLISVLKYNYRPKKTQKIIRSRKNNGAITNMDNIGTENVSGVDRDSAFRHRVDMIKPKTIMNIVDSITNTSKLRVISRTPTTLELSKKMQKLRFKHKNKVYDKLRNGIEVNSPVVDSSDMDRMQLFSESFFGGKASTKIYSKLDWSFACGPRMRKYRKLKRSFQSKNIIKYTTLIWFWQKVAKLLCFYMEWTLRYLK